MQVLAMMRPSDTEFRISMDNLNVFMKNYGLPLDMQLHWPAEVEWIFCQSFEHVAEMRTAAGQVYRQRFLLRPPPNRA